MSHSRIKRGSRWQKQREKHATKGMRPHEARPILNRWAQAEEEARAREPKWDPDRRASGMSKPTPKRKSSKHARVAPQGYTRQGNKRYWKMKDEEYAARKRR